MIVIFLLIWLLRHADHTASVIWAWECHHVLWTALILLVLA